MLRNFLSRAEEEGEEEETQWHTFSRENWLNSTTWRLSTLRQPPVAVIVLCIVGDMCMQAGMRI